MKEWSRAAWDRIVGDWDRIPHAWLFEAEAGMGRTLFARDLVGALLCESPNADRTACGDCPSCHYLEALLHPDYHDLLYEELPEEHPGELTDSTVKVGKGGKTVAKYKSKKALRAEAEGVAPDEISPVIFKNDTGLERAHRRPGGKPLPTIGIDTVRRVLENLDVAASRGGRKVVLICPAERLTIEASNALLKSLEEPPRGVVFILVAASADALLPTIRSRCRLETLPKPGPEAARACLEELHPDWREERIRAHLAFHGGRPLIAESPEEIGAREGLLKELKNPSVPGFMRYVQDCDGQKLPLSAFLDWFLKWLLDVASIRQGFGARYYPGEERLLGIVSRHLDAGAPFGLIDRINHLSRYSGISLNRKTQMQGLLLEYLRMHRY